MKRIMAAIVGMIVISIAGLILAEESQNEAVIRYYWRKVQQAFEAQDAATDSLTYKVTAISYYEQIGKGGRIDKVDSATIVFYWRSQQIDSQQFLAGDANRFGSINLSYADFFSSDYHLFGFPNDTGGKGLAIGFDPDSGSSQPAGLITIDRYRYMPLGLILYYPKSPGMRNLSRSFRFTEIEGRIFPDSVCEVGSRRGIFSTEDYRIETSVTSIVPLP